MRLFRCLIYRLAKKDTAGILFERAREIAFEITNGQTPISFYLDYGYDYQQCAIYSFYKAHDCSELVPYICLTDFYSSRNGYYRWAKFLD